MTTPGPPTGDGPVEAPRWCDTRRGATVYRCLVPGCDAPPICAACAAANTPDQPFLPLEGSHQ